MKHRALPSKRRARRAWRPPYLEWPYRHWRLRDHEYLKIEVRCDDGFVYLDDRVGRTRKDMLKIFTKIEKEIEKEPQLFEKPRAVNHV